MAAVLAACRLLGLALCVRAYNVDMEGWVVYRGQERTMFGFSVAAYTDLRGSWVLVGAPQAATTQPGVVRGGAVYKCSAEPPSSDASRLRNCQQIPFDVKGNNVASGRPMDDKSGQWFGAMVASSPGVNNTGVVVACAPRYLWFSRNQERREPVGTCYVAKDGFSKIEEYSPCRTDGWGYHRQGFCQAGFGSAINKDGDRLFIGAVGSWYWQGKINTEGSFGSACRIGSLMPGEW
ncbi:integrin alpha-PS2-like [Pollicipes pollicipes]|uniref:integrin alpha-PS2-like n=1 Tax=Pollicipes pollicipes TaxID=41117 RepID=UPI0018857627|nr:integrin alpha-PS2-like [Pollicipes pollicipes]